MDERRRKRNGTEFSNSIQQGGRKQNSNTMEETKVKSVYEEGNKERINESRIGIFLMNIVYKVYETVKKLQNQNKEIYQVYKLQERKTGQLQII